LVELSLRHVGDEESDEAGALDGRGRSLYFKAVARGLRGRLAARAKAQDDVESGITEVLRVSPPLAIVPEHGNPLASQCVDVAVKFQKQLQGSSPFDLSLPIKKNPAAFRVRGLR